MPRFRVLAACALLLPPLVARAAPGATTVAAPTLSVTQILDKNAQARGGLAAWHAAQTLSWKGKMGAGGSTYVTVTPAGKLQTKQREEMQLPFTLEFRRPLKSRLELVFDGQTAVQVYDGAHGWKLRPFLGRTSWDPYSPDELRQAGEEPGIDGYLLDAVAKGIRVDYAGTEKVENHPAYKLRLTLKDGQTRLVWVDATSFLDVKVEGAPRRLDGRPRRVEIYQRDFKTVQGLMVPHLLETHVQGVNRTEKIIIESVKVNPPLDEARFSKPS